MTVTTAAVGGYLLEGGDGVYLLLDPKTRDIEGTVVSLGGGKWRVRRPAAGVTDVHVPDVARPWVQVAEQALDGQPTRGASEDGE